MADTAYDVIVVGAGFGGSACAGLLAKRGLKVLLVEKNARAGGKAMSLAKNGFTYTAWVVIGAPVIGNLYEAVANELDVADLMKLVAPGRQGSIYKNAAGKYARLPDMPVGQTDPNVVFDWLEIKPEDRDRALAFFAHLTMMPAEEINQLHGISFHDWITRQNVPRSLYAFLVSLCCDGMFMVPADLLEAAEAITSLQHMFLRHGGMFCQGGYGRVAEAYCEAVRRHGGTVLMKAKTEQIIAADGRVSGVVTGQGTFTAPIVISNAGLQPTVMKLVGEQHFDQKYVQYVKSLLPSWALLGYRYFLRQPVLDVTYGVIFSDNSPWSLDRLNQAHAGRASREGVVYFEVPSNYDPAAAPPGKQIVMTGSFCPPSPQMTAEEIAAWANAGEAIFFKAFPALADAIEDKELYTPKDVSNLTRDSAIHGHGGETIGLGQVVGQCGPGKPTVEAPLRGLFYVGCDAGGSGVGTQQAIESGMKVADAVLRYHQASKAAA
ncbi:MAG: NAD(P)/FAD-dependent oxidoreductase [Deltaproteobacteria bacterium]|nr:NAD(P)/FAD-dependent oxidoreductase [Deltaproteobacteria bacterium]